MSATSRQMTQTSLGKIRISMQRLAGRYPFHAKVLERFEIGLRSDVETMGVTVAGDAVRLLAIFEVVD